ncbi:replicative DNA helicase [Paraflavitalea speifideaquila]|uniref:replicative DNA helicase n=1 Tax=Paraflavitalea speifideaquila TaxID=3076558 RepID=UPI0028E859F2|nr:replicative DNA helicase [Paraflavitalea speifideiaquila]
MNSKNTFWDRKQDKRRPAVDMSNMVYGKVPPQAKDMEEAVLGALLLENVFDVVSEILKPECFYVDANQRIYGAMFRLQQRNQPIDILTVVEELRNQDELEMVGGPYYVTRLTNSVVSSANIETHSRIILQKYIQRQIIKLCGEAIGMAYEDSTDVFDLLAEHEMGITALTTGSLKQTYSALDSIMVNTVTRIEHLRKQNVDITGIPSGFPALDKVTNGWQNTDLIILAARPAVGKTAFALNLVRNSSLDPFKRTPVALFSLEMSKEQLCQRMLSAESDIWLEKISRGKMDDHEMNQLYEKGIQRLAQASIFIDDTAALNIMELRARARRLKRKHNIGLIIIDYLQLMSGMSGKGGNREQEISGISRGLKQIAKELNVPIIALSQLSRAVESRKEGNKMPQLSDLRESGAIEQDADMVIFMYRPDYYDQNTNEHGESTKGETHIRIAKHRNGSLETIKLRALLHIQKFIEMEDMNLPSGLPTGQGQKWSPVRTNFYETERDDQPF